MTEEGASHSRHRYLGHGRRLLDGLEKVSGRAAYAADLTLPRMLYGRPVLSPYASARIAHIDASHALGVEGAVAVLTDADLPSRAHPITSRPSAVLARGRVVFVGQPVALVLAETEAAAADAAQLVDVEYEVGEPVIDPEAAISADSPLVWPEGLDTAAGTSSIHAAVAAAGHDDPAPRSNVIGHVHFQRGDAARALTSAGFVIRRRFTNAAVHQAYMEPHAVLADYDPTARELTIYTGTQGPFLVRDLIADLVALPRQRVRVEEMTVGGGFGAKYGIIEPLAAAAAMAVGRPVRIVLSRSEDFLTTTPAPACTIDLELGVAETGEMTALRARAVADNGAFPVDPDGIGGIIAALLGGYYECANVDIECFDVLTNKQPAGAYRAPGATTATFALESTVDEAARQAGIDPIEFRLANVARAGSPMGNGEPWPELGLRECLERLREHAAGRQIAQAEGEGVGVAIGCWPGAVSPAAAVCKVDGDGSVQLHVGSADISGAHGSLVLAAAEVLQLDPAAIAIVPVDTRSAPYGPPAGGSQTTYSVAGAVRDAAESVRAQLLEVASLRLEAAVEDLELTDAAIHVRGTPARRVTIAEAARAALELPGGPGPIIGHGRSALSVNAPGSAAHLVRVRVDRETGAVDLVDYVAVQDVGFAINPTLVEGQVHGGVGQGIGWAAHEAMSYDEGGQLRTSTFVDYAIPTVDIMPPITVVMVENRSATGPFGARLVGEPPVIPGAAALANAIMDAVGVRLTAIPIGREDVRAALDLSSARDRLLHDQRGSAFHDTEQAPAVGSAVGPGSDGPVKI